MRRELEQKRTLGEPLSPGDLVVEGLHDWSMKEECPTGQELYDCLMSADCPPGSLRGFLKKLKVRRSHFLWPHTTHKELLLFCYLKFHANAIVRRFASNDYIYNFFCIFLTSDSFFIRSFLKASIPHLFDVIVCVCVCVCVCVLPSLAASVQQGGVVYRQLFFGGTQHPLVQHNHFLKTWLLPPLGIERLIFKNNR